MTEYSDASIVCCYYKTQREREIHCESLIDAGRSTKTSFRSETEKQEYMRSHCFDIKRCDLCMLKSALDSKYE